MIRAIRPAAMAQDDAAMVAGWNISPNVAHTLLVAPGSSACGVLLFDAEMTTLVASGATLAGTGQPCTLTPQSGQTINMIDVDLGWHLLLTTTGTESQRTIRIGPAVDLPDEIHPIYGDDDLAVVRATAGIDGAAHYVDLLAVSCPNGLGAGLGSIVSAPVDSTDIVGQTESIVWTGTPDGAIEQPVIRRHVAIAPEHHVDPVPVTPPAVEDDEAETDSETAASGNVLTNDEAGLTVVAVNGLTANVGVPVAGSNGGVFTVASTGVWTFDPDGEFSTLEGSETAATSVAYYASDGIAEASAALTVTVTSGAALWTFADITTAIWLDTADPGTLTVDGSVVAQIADKSGNSRNAVASGGARPALITNEQNGNTVVRFNGTAHAMALQNSAALTNAASEMHVFFAAKITPGATAAYRRAYNFSVGLASNSSFRASLATYGGVIRALQRRLDSNSAYIQDYAYTSATPLIIHMRHNWAGATIGRRVSAGDAVSSATGQGSGVTSATNSTVVSIGGDTYSSSQFGGLDFYEMAVIMGELSEETRQKIEGYLAHKWGLVATLPSDHPYKSAPPTV